MDSIKSTFATAAAYVGSAVVITGVYFFGGGGAVAAGVAVPLLAYLVGGPRQLKPTNTEAKVITARIFPNIFTVKKVAVRNTSRLYLKFGATDPSPVPLKVFNVKVDKTAKHALVLSDKMKIDAEVVFQISIADGDDAVIKAVESLQGQFTDEKVQEVAEARFDSALRLAAANMTIEEINTHRDKFIAEVKKGLKLDDLGLVLNEVALRTLTPALLEAYDEKNSFDAVGKQLATQIVETSRQTRNQITQLADTQIAETNKVQAQARFKIDEEKKAAELAKDEAIAKATAEQEKRVAEARAESMQAAELARLAALQATESARIAQERQIGIADQDKAKQVAVAKAEADRAAETAERDKQIALHAKSAEEAAAQEKANQARAKAVAAEQAVITARETATAERAKAVSVIESEAEAQKEAVTQKVAADVKVYVAKQDAEAAATEATGLANAVRIDAEAQANATLKKAEATAQEIFLKADATARGKMEDAKAERARNEAMNSLSPEARAQIVDLERVRITPEVVGKMGAAFEKVKEFSVTSMNGGSPFAMNGTAAAVNGAFNGGATSSNGVVGQMVDSYLALQFSQPLMSKLVKGLGGDPKVANFMPAPLPMDLAAPANDLGAAAVSAVTAEAVVAAKKPGNPRPS